MRQALDGDNVLANIAAATPLGTLTGFGYWLERDEATGLGSPLSNRTLGLRLAGRRKLGGANIAWQASHARQQGHGGNPQDYAARYWLGDIGINLGGPTLGLGYEVLGADDGRPLTSFQTPLGTNFRFQGWADRFLTTPDGLRDLHARAGWSWPMLGPARNLTLQAVWHRYDSDRAARRYGEELNLIAEAAFDPVAVAIRFADYRADGFAQDTRKLWLQLDWTI